MNEELTSPKPGLEAAMAATSDGERETKSEPQVYSTMSALAVRDDQRPEPPEIWGGLTYTEGEIMVIIGPAGLGKSRLSLNLAINHILGRDFAGLATRPSNAPQDQEPLTWLFFGNENSFFRFRRDLQKMLGGLSESDLQKLDKHLFLPTMDLPDDYYISFESPENIERFKATIRQRDASVVVMDPWGAIINGNECVDLDVRHSLQDIRAMLCELSADLKHPVVAIVLNHSRNGIKEMLNACGSEKDNYGKNSKAVHSVVRCVWNLRIGTMKTPCDKIELIHAKGNDLKMYGPRCVALNQNTMCYDWDENFDHVEFQAELVQAVHDRFKLTPEERQNAAAKKKAAIAKCILDHINDVGAQSRKDLEVFTASKKIAKNAASSTISELASNGEIGILVDKSNHRTVCAIDKVAAVVKGKEPGFYRLDAVSKEALDSNQVLHDALCEVVPSLFEGSPRTSGSHDGE